MGRSTVLKIGDKVRNKALNCEAEITNIEKGSLGMIHIEIKTEFGTFWCFPHDLEESWDNGF